MAQTPTRARAADGSYISWREHLIDGQELAGGLELRGADGFEMADLDGDGFPDIVSMHEDSDHIRLAFGSSDPDRWELVTLASGDEARAAEDAAIADLNGDGLPDIIVACELEHLIYFQNPGNDVRKGDWPRSIPEPARGRGSWIRVYVADFNKDGRLEVVAPNKGDPQPEGAPIPKFFPLKEISIFEITGEPLDSASWHEHVLTRTEVPMNSRPVDLDGDGDLDILAGSRYHAHIFWFENLLERKGGKLEFREHPIQVKNRNVPWERGPRRITAMNLDFADLNGDGRLDIVLQESPSLNVWLEQPENIHDPWNIVPIGDIAPDDATAVRLLDIDGDGDLDLFTGGYSALPRDHDGEHVTASSVVGRLAWFENSGDPNGDWVRHDISRRVRAMFDEFLPRDMDGDGDWDLIATRGNSGKFDGVLWLEQVRSREALQAFQPARKHESRHLPLPPASASDGER